MIDMLDIPDFEQEPDPPPAKIDMLACEAIHRLTYGVTGAWADERAMRTLIRSWDAGAMRGPGLAAPRRAGLIEGRRLPHDYHDRLKLIAGEKRPPGGALMMYRMTDAGAVNHFAWRSDLQALRVAA
jgi:hypothetical protein